MIEPERFQMEALLTLLSSAELLMLQSLKNGNLNHVYIRMFGWFPMYFLQASFP